MPDGEDEVTCDVCDYEMEVTPTYTLLKDHGIVREVYFCTIKCFLKWGREMKKMGVG